ncbi:MAG: hydroxyacid dehydrogenase [Chthoniobacterales bacterium]
MKAVYLSDHPGELEKVWGPLQQKRLRALVEISDLVIGRSEMDKHAALLSEVEVVFSTWGMPPLTEAQLDFMPKLRAVFYAAGTTKYFATPFLKRGILIVSAAAANAVPVAEFALSQIIFALKLGWTHVRNIQYAADPKSWQRLDMPGVYESTVGIISLGMIGQKVCEFLNPFSVQKIAFDPIAPKELFQKLDAESVSLEELFRQSDVVTLHAPSLRQTEGLITGSLLSSMKPNATFINTARGSIVQETEMVEVLKRRPDLTAVLDVTNPEPPPVDSPLYSLPNVILTPHIAGSMGKEVRRMSDMMIDEFVRWTEGKPSPYAVTFETLERNA